MMSRLPKIFGFLLGAISALALVLALYLHTTWDGNRVRHELAQQVRERTARQIAMERAPKLAFRPLPTVVIEGFALGERDGPGIPLRIGRVEAGVALLPLLRGRIEIRTLRLLDLDATLVRNRADWSLSDVMRGARLESPWPFKLGLESFTLERARLRLRDDTLGHALTVERIHLSTGSLQAGAHGRIAGEGTLTEGPGAAAGGISFDIAYLLDAEGYDIEAANLGFRGDAWGATGLDCELTVRSGRGDHGNALALQGLALRAKGRVGTGSVTLNATGERLASQNEALALQTLKANLLITDGAERTEASFDTASIAPRTADFPGEPLHAAFRSQNGERQTSGQLTARIAYRPQRARVELEAIDARWRTAAKGTPDGRWIATVSGKASTTLLGGRVDLDLLARVDASEMRLNAAYEQSRDIPWLFSFDGARLDAPAAASALKLDGAGALLAPLARLHGTGQVRIGSLKLGPLHGTALSAQLDSGKGGVALTDLAVQAYGGRIEGGARYEPASGSLTLDNRLSGIDLDALRQALRRTWPLRGTLAGRWNLRGHGANWPEIARALDGDIQLSVAPAHWSGMALDDFLRAVRPALKDRSEARRPNVPREQQGFESLSARCTLVGGRAECGEFTGKAAWVRVGGSGTLQLTDGALDWLTRIAVQSAGPIPRDLVGLRGVTVPVRLRGPLARPTYSLDWQAAPPRPVPTRPKPGEAIPANETPAPASAAG
ncbi:hypothetical protein GCM10025771_06910 [Niveibacterium umoris]|uniref:AsmA protein n=1 Tax=Niveibacterium umoris TaxID=1193620 RepID=A0A840BM97_9RHOO|nr:AsmA family protein [Niveibacterium umoris]MBB4013763.1 AsmA protein [Niveibacterium umoris]